MTPQAEGPDTERTIADVEERLAARLPEAAPDTIHDEVVVAVDRYANAPVQDFVAIIAERDARAAVEETIDGR